MRMVTRHYKNLGYTVASVEKDNVGWDLEASLNRHLLRLEVKGLSGSRAVVELTPNEYTQMRKYRDSYRVCIVTSALGEKPELSVFAFSPDSNAWEDDKGRVLNITEIVSARLEA